MSNKLKNGFYVKLSAVAILAASLSISALPGAQAQSTDDESSMNTTKSSGDGTANGTTTTSTTGDAGSSSTAGSSSSTPSTPTASTAPTSDIPAGVLWTDPKYAVKEVPAPVRVPVPGAKGPTTGTTKAATPAKTAESANAYDEKEAAEFSKAAGIPQYLWTKQDQPAKGATSPAEIAKEVKAYHRMFVEKFVANMSVPNSATLVENSSTNYVYLISFTIDAKGKIINVDSVKSFGQLNAVNLADDNENATMTNSIKIAVIKCSPVKTPPTGIAPWYMLLKYEPNSGKVFVTNVTGL